MIFGQFYRYFGTGNPVWQSVSKSLLAKLRKKTGYTFANCKKALELNENDLAKAEVWLKEQAQALGWSKAEKLQGRSTSQGLIAVMVNKNHGAMMELNCETDFVARNKVFQGLAEVVISSVLKQFSVIPTPNEVNKVSIDSEVLKNIAGLDGKPLTDHVALAIGNLGENITIKRALFMNTPLDHQLVGCTHPAPVGSQPIYFGKYGSLLAFKSDNDNKLLGMQLCQHIIGMNPTKIGDSEVDVPSANSDDESILIHQDYLLDPELTVQQVLLDARVKLIDFSRFEMGESNEIESEFSKEPLKTCA